MWYKNKGQENDVAVSTRIRLARNLNGYPFEGRLNEEQAKEICEKYGFVPALEKEIVPESLRDDIQEKGWLQLLPGVHECDGFFIARLKKTN